MPTELTYDLVTQVRPPLEKWARRTPLDPSPELEELSGHRVSLKCENLQRTGSFKIRGAAAKMISLSEQDKARGVCAASAGNHGKAVAWLAHTMGIAATIYVPAVVPRNKLDAMRRFGAHVVVSRHRGYDDMEAEAIQAAAEQGKTWLSPYDDPWVMAGAATVGCEIFEECEELDALIVPVGGGGLAVGVGLVARRLSPKTRILGINTSASPGMYLSRREGKAQVKVPSEPTIAEGLEGGVSERAFELANRYVDDVIVVEESALGKAIAQVLRFHRFAIEGSAAVGVAALLDGLIDSRHKRVVVLLSGGNIDYSLLRRIVGEHDEE